MLLMMLASSRSSILPSWVYEEEIIAGWRNSPMSLTHFLLIFQCPGTYFVRHRRTVFAISGATATTKEVIHSLVFLKSWTAYLSCIFTEYFTVSLSTAVDSVVLGEEGLVLL